MTTWNTVPLGSVVTFQRGYDLPHRARKQGAVPIVSSAGITDYHNVPMVNPPGVVTGRYGTIGEVFLVTEPFWPLNTTLYVRDFHGNDPCFVYHLLQRFDFQPFSGKSGVPGVNRNDLHLEPVALPEDVNEQRAIAAALSDVDALLGGLDRLIAKKRDLKQAAMQQLLTGLTRLPGFNGEWDVKRVGELADPNQRWSFTGGPFGSNLKFSDYTDDGVRIIQLQNIGDGAFLDSYRIFTSRTKADELISCNIYPGEIILSKMGDPVARACLIPPAHDRYLMCSDGIRLAVDKSRHSTHFILAMINAPKFREKAAAAGTGSTRKRIGLTELRNLELRCPSLREQTAIAECFSDMAKELAALDARRDKTRALKQGMMQELLTGRTRLA